MAYAEARHIRAVASDQVMATHFIKRTETPLPLVRFCFMRAMAVEGARDLALLKSDGNALQW